MRTLVLSLTAATAILAAVSALPAGAITLRAVPGLKAATADVSDLTEVVYICKQRYWSGKRYCYWRPGGYRWRWRWRWWR